MKRVVVLLILLGFSLFSFSTTGCSSEVSVKILSASTLTNGIEGKSYYVKLEAKGSDSYKWFFANFKPNKPEGLIFTENGTIFAAPSIGSAGDYTFAVTVISANAVTERKSFTLKIHEVVNITDFEFVTQANASFDETFGVEGGSGLGYMWTAGVDMPAWLTLDQNTGQLTGTVPPDSNATSVEFEITAADTSFNANSDTKMAKILIGPQILNPSVPTEIFAGQEFDIEFEIMNPCTEDMTNLTGMMQFTAFGGVTGDLDAEYTVTADPANPTEILAGETGTFKFTIEVDQAATKAISTEPANMLITATYDPNAQTATVSYDWAVRVWEQLADMPEIRRWGTSAYYDGYIYYFGGVDDNGTEVNSIYKYDVTNDLWENLSDPGLPTPVALPQAVLWNKAVVIGDKIYVVAGYNFGSGYDNNVVEFDPVNLTCQNVGTISTTMRVGAAVVTDGTDIFVFGRWGGRSIEKYDVMAATASNMTAETSGGSAMFPGCFYDGNCYIFGGTPAGGGQYSGTVFVDKYDPVNDVTTRMADLQFPVTAHSGALLHDSFWIVGGSDSPTDYSVIQRYDFLTDSSTTCGHFPFKVYCHSVCSDGNAIYSMSGQNEDTGDPVKSLHAMYFE